MQVQLFIVKFNFIHTYVCTYFTLRDRQIKCIDKPTKVKGILNSQATGERGEAIVLGQSLVLLFISKI